MCEKLGSRRCSALCSVALHNPHIGDSAASEQGPRRLFYHPPGQRATLPDRSPTTVPINRTRAIVFHDLLHTTHTLMTIKTR